MKALTGISIALAVSLLIGFAVKSTSTPSELLPEGPFPGDDLLPTAPMVYDQVRTINAPRSEIWPWLLQLGKGRAGWYCPASWEKWMPASWPAARAINPERQNLAIGDRVEDYGFNAEEDFFIVAAVEPERALVFTSERYGAVFTWSLLLHEVEPDAEGVARTVVHLRFRGQIAATGVKRRVIVWGGGVLDHLTTAPLLAGLAERVEGSMGNR